MRQHPSECRHDIVAAVAVTVAVVIVVVVAIVIVILYYYYYCCYACVANEAALALALAVPATKKGLTTKQVELLKCLSKPQSSS